MTEAQILKYFPFNQINSFGVEGYWPILPPLLPQAQATTGCPWCTLRSALPTHTRGPLIRRSEGGR